MMKPYEDQINRLHRQTQERQAARFRLAQTIQPGLARRSILRRLFNLWLLVLVHD
ncbi:MAG: hypothetical protein K8I60_06065 [Anaerolineae bacterium]|nr:hypothetical protein [Anaerolineae bacterium]